jgi:hypothetical protein
MSLNVQDLHPVFRRQMAALADGDLEALVANYHPEAQLLRFDATATGVAQISDLLADYLRRRPELVELTEYSETEDTVFYRAVMNLGGAPENSFGAIVVREDKVWRQVAGFGD